MNTETWSTLKLEAVTAAETWRIEYGEVTANPQFRAGGLYVEVNKRPIRVAYWAANWARRHCRTGERVDLGGRLPPIDADSPELEAEDFYLYPPSPPEKEGADSP